MPNSGKRKEKKEEKENWRRFDSPFYYLLICPCLERPRARLQDIFGQISTGPRARKKLSPSRTSPAI